MEQYYIFTIKIGGYGKDVNEAWEDAINNANLDEMEQSGDYIIDTDETK